MESKHTPEIFWFSEGNKLHKANSEKEIKLKAKETGMRCVFLRRNQGKWSFASSAPSSEIWYYPELDQITKP